MNLNIDDYLAYLPLNIKKQYLANKNLTNVEILKHSNGDLGKFINVSFCWGMTPEGREYWENLHFEYLGTRVRKQELILFL